MTLPRPPLNPAQDIPNNPFFYPETNFIQSSTGPLIVGTGLAINYATGTIFSTGGGGGGIVSISGTAPIAVTSGSSPVVSIASASTTTSGAVQLFDGTNSTSTALALTANQGKLLQDQINSLLLTPGIELAGTLDASTGFVASVTTVGTSAGYTAAAVLPAASLATNNTYVIVTTPGTVTPPGGVATAATQGDWFLVSETSPGVYAWQFLNVGFDAPAATTTVAGIVCLSTDALAQAGTDTTTALTPAAAASAYIPKTCITAKGDLITGTAANTPVALTVGTNGQVLLACSTAPNGICWGVVPRATPTTFGTVVGCTSGNTISLGEEALLAGSTCSNSNIGIGYQALRGVTTGYKNVAIGTGALRATVTGADNIAVGPDTLNNLTTGFGNVAIGNVAGFSITNAVNNVYIGNGSACKNLASGSVAIGAGTMLCSTDLVRSVAVGENALRFNVDGFCTTAVGWSALCNATQSYTNTAIGALAGKNLTSGAQNVAIGYNVDLPSNTGNAQLAIGFDSAEWWLTGDGTKAIRPGAGIRDCNGSTGTSGQVLTSNGANALVWSTAGTSRVNIPGLFFPSGATTDIVLAPNNNNGNAAQVWVRGLRASDGRAQIRTGTWIRDFNNNIIDMAWASGTVGMFNVNSNPSGPGIRITNTSGSNLEVVVQWIPIAQ